MTLTPSESIIKAYWALGDYFSRLGGAARCRSMVESDIPLFIGCELAKRISFGFNEAEYSENEFFDAAKPIIPEVDKLLKEIHANPEELATMLAEFITYVDGKYKPEHRSSRWLKFIDQFSDNRQNQKYPYNEADLHN